MGEVQVAISVFGAGIGFLVGLIVASALWVQHGKLDKNEETKFSVAVSTVSFFGFFLGLFISCLFQRSRKAAHWCGWPGCYEAPPEIVDANGIAAGTSNADSDDDYHSVGSGDLTADRENGMGLPVREAAV